MTLSPLGTGLFKTRGLDEYGTAAVGWLRGAGLKATGGGRRAVHAPPRARTQRRTLAKEKRFASAPEACFYTRISKRQCNFTTTTTTTTENFTKHLTYQNHVKRPTTIYYTSPVQLDDR